MTAIAHAYWRSIQRGKRSLGQIPAAVKDVVRALADQALASGEIQQTDYDHWMRGDAT